MIKDDFIVKDDRHYHFAIGKTVASSLSGFIAGIVITLIIVLIMSQ